MVNSSPDVICCIRDGFKPAPAVLHHNTGIYGCPVQFLVNSDRQARVWWRKVSEGDLILQSKHKTMQSLGRRGFFLKKGVDRPFGLFPVCPNRFDHRVGFESLRVPKLSKSG
eukprot:1195024-Prorocentrum_minimum.AAC.6